MLLAYRRPVSTGTSVFIMPPLATEQTASLLSELDSGLGDCVCKVKCVLVGDGAVGKTSLVVSYTTNGYPTEYVPTAFDNYSAVVTVDNQPVRLQLCDTAGQDDFDSLRPLCYPQTNVFLLCFSVVCPTSFHNILEKWLPEVRQHCPKAPLLLVGTQCDLRSDVKVLIELANYREQPVPEAEARQLAQRMGAVTYLECSALTQKNLKEVFDTAILAALQQQNPDLITTWGNKSKRPMDVAAVTSSQQKIKTKSTPHSNDVRKKKGWKRFCCFCCASS